MSVLDLMLDLLLLELVVLFLGILSITLMEWRARAHTLKSTSDLRPDERAEALLRDLLDEREYRQLKQCGYLDVVSTEDTQRTYRIPAYAGMGLVRVYERGTAVCELCIQPVEPLPSAEVALVHKLLIQADEKAYLANARVYPFTRHVALR